MTNATTGEQQSTDKAKEAMALSEAVRIVREAISAEENRLKQIAKDEEADPVLLEGYTDTGYRVEVMVDSAKIARIMLDYNHPLYTVLGDDSPQGMWDEMARMVGLRDVGSVDL